MGEAYVNAMEEINDGPRQRQCLAGKVCGFLTLEEGEAPGLSARAQCPHKVINRKAQSEHFSSAFPYSGRSHATRNAAFAPSSVSNTRLQALYTSHYFVRERMNESELAHGD